MTTSEPRADVFVVYADADRAWVDGFLLDALTAAGIQYVSEAAFSLGAPRLVELERAVKQSRRVVLVVSSAYLADDLVAFTDLLAQSYGLETATWPVIPLLLEPVQLSPRLRVLQHLDVSDPTRRTEAVARLCRELAHPLPGGQARITCPYPGMVAFREADQERFFGRESEQRELLERLRLHPFLAVIGPSGSGKSSLVFAGLVPELRRSGLFGSGDWLVRTIRPGEHPLQVLSDALETTPDLLGDDPRASSPAVVRLLAGHPSVRRLLLVVDQFEELFTLGGDDQAAFAAGLRHLAETPDCLVVLTVRADFYSELMELSLWPTIQAHRYEVPRLDERALRRAIVRPAEQVQVFLEPALVERLLADAAGEPGALPLVQETLVLLWERLERRFLPGSAYTALTTEAREVQSRTGLQIAMARRADAALAGLNAEQQQVARRVFLRLVQFGEGRADTRRQQPVTALRAQGDDLAGFERTIRHLTDQRLLTTGGADNGADRRVDIAHEALIAGWPTLQAWLTERREAEQTRRRLEAKAVEWARLGRGTGGLLDEVELLEAERWLASEDADELGHDDLVADFVAASRAAREVDIQRARQVALFRRLSIGAITFLAALLLAGGWWGFDREARTEIEFLRVRADSAARAEADAATQRRLAAEAQAAQQHAEQQARLALSRQLASQALGSQARQLDLALLLGAEALEVEATFEARSSLLRVLQQTTGISGMLHADQNVGPLVYSPDGALLAGGLGSGSVVLWDTATRRTRQVLQGLRLPVFVLAFSQDGRLLAAGDGKGQQLMVWETATGKPVVPAIEAGLVFDLAFRPDGRLLVISEGQVSEPLELVTLANLAAQGGRLFPEWSPSAPPPQPEFDRISPNCARLFSSAPVIAAWDAATHQRQPSLDAPGGLIWGPVISADGSSVFVANREPNAHVVIDIATGEERLKVPTTSDGALRGALSADGSLLALVGSAEAAPTVWDVTTRQRLDLGFTYQTSISAMTFSPDRRTLAAATGHTVLLWDLQASPPLRQTFQAHGRAVGDLSFSPDGRTLLSQSQDETKAWDFSSPTGPVLRTSGGALPFPDVLSADGRIAASVEFDIRSRKAPRVLLWDPATLLPLGLPAQGTGLLNSSSESTTYRGAGLRPDQRTLVVLSSDHNAMMPGQAFRQTVQVAAWDVLDRRPIGTPARLTFDDYVDDVALSPAGELLVVSVSEDRAHRSAERPYPAHILLYEIDLAGGPTLRQRGAELPYSMPAPYLTFSSDGNKLAAAGQPGANVIPGSGGIVVWDTTNGQPQGPVLKPTSFLSTLTFSRDGRTLATLEYESRRLAIWELASHLQVGGDFDQPQDTGRLALSPDGKRVATGHSDGKITLFDLEPSNWRALACRIASRELTEAEWRQYVAASQPRRASCSD
jgi:WD40 repeat protein